MTLIIAWSPTQKGRTGKSGYQIWGDERILSKKQLTQSLRTLYESYADWETGNLMSWSWAMTGLRASELNSLMKKLSKDHSIDTFHYGASFAFGRIEFKRRWPDLDEDALKKIAKAIDGVLKKKRVSKAWLVRQQWHRRKTCG